MATIKSTLDIHLDLTKPVEELTQVISAILMSTPVESHKGILEGLDMEVGNALAAIQKSENDQQQIELQEKK